MLTLILATAALAVGAATLLWPRPADDELSVLCAAVLAPPIDEIREVYQRQTGTRLTTSVDGSGALLAKLKAGAPADVYLPAEQHFADAAVAAGLTEQPERLVRLESVIAVTKGNPKKVTGLADLLRDDVRVSLAEPDLAAAGHVTREVMTRLKLWDQFARRAKTGGVSFQGTVTKSASDVVLGASDASVVWLPMVKPFSLDAVRDPALDDHAESAYAAVTAGSARRMQARRFVHFLTSSPEAAEVFERHGFPKALADAQP